ncbi:MAG: hypothetical protein WCR53_01805 [Bacteroidaceae bacterium]|jgi:hypothetical protein
MKKIHILVAAIALLGFASCDNGNGLTNDVLGIYPLSTGPSVTYADQTVDSFTIVSTKSWNTSVTANWTTLNPLYVSRNQDATSIKYTTCPIYFAINTTGQIRTSTLIASNGEHSVGRTYLQAYWLNITKPSVAFTSSQTSDDATSTAQYDGAYFTLQVPKDSVKSSINFEIFASSATLTTDADWIMPKQQQCQKGTHSIALSFSPNNTNAERKAIYTLTTSNGISNIITIVQKAK